MKNKSLKAFLNEFTELADQKEEVRMQEMERLIEKWKKMIKKIQTRGGSQAEEYRNWHHLKLSIEWVKETLVIERKSLHLICWRF
ncbi:hypothetical protein [Sunxiuqinia elliptica]|uniref:Uncharacterized protein n=1 Tax=Sunxiuqinia elliptica TaxID=655355 RepID=A0A1I2JYT2_9BACT|nr:hypothetical protein [Sunxiuqinia elliptica]SFF59734.1 hypothetical protein SAMN05216283_11077 [Sunxiuqinia elliptica]